MVTSFPVIESMNGPFRRERIRAHSARRFHRQRFSKAVVFCLFTFVAGLLPALAEPHHAIAMHGEPLYPEGFDHFRYANPAAPKGGRLTLGVLGTFDSLNPLAVRGTPVQQVRNYVVESLLARGQDEPFTLYGLLAETVDTDEARSYVTFQLNPLARFSDGTPVTAEDVLFSWKLLRDKGRPNHRYYYGKVAQAEKIGERGVRFDFKESGDRELPLILGLMPVLAKHALNAQQFEDSGLKPLLGSGPYRVGEAKQGERVTLLRNPDYWGRDLAVNRGLYNFGEIRIDYFRDSNTWFEAFKRQLYDVRFETDPGRWTTQYDFPAAHSRHLVRENFVSAEPRPMMAFVFNTRRAIFSDRRVRAAINQLFDFEWANTNLYYGAYKRNGSFFEASELSALGRPADGSERALLAPFPDAVRPDVLAGTYKPPVSDGSGRDRQRLKQSLALFAQAGWELRNGKLVNRKTGAPFRFEIMVSSRDEERLALAFSNMLKRAGISATVRFVDSTQFEQRRMNYDFEMMPYTWQQSLSPGNEQNFYFGSASADTLGTRNYMGVKSKAADAMIEAMIAAHERPGLVAAARALDRILISGDYVVPLFYPPALWVARWPWIGRPTNAPLTGYQIESWWRVPESSQTKPDPGKRP
jgi:peptide/nickel transport system substrate-binding protein